MNKKEKGASIKSDRKRTNILKDYEYKTLEYLCAKIPSWVSPDMLTFLGLVGSLIVFSGLLLAKMNTFFLLLSVFGLMVHWFGDSLDGRLAYYRKTPRKWYGWALDINADWLSVIFIGMGFYFYFPDFKIVAFIFVVAYGGSMIVSLLRYKIADKYVIDTGSLGPTELRIILALVMCLEIVVSHTLWTFGLFGSLLLIIFNTIESKKILALGDDRDARERSAKRKVSQVRYT